MIILEACDLQWIKGTDDDPGDQYAHGRVRFEIDGLAFVRAEDGVWTVSGAALYLLRTLEDSHTTNRPTAEGYFLFPCCAHSCWFVGEGRYKLTCGGGDKGIDIEIINIGESVEIGRTDAGQRVVQLTPWRAAVCGFADQIRSFYDRSAPKIEPEDPLDMRGWNEF